MNHFAEIVNPAGNRSFKKGLYFMMMYENRVTIKKFGDTPKNMSWWEFYQVMRSIFDEDAAGARTWQNHFGGDNEAQENEPTGEHTTAETPEPEDDNAAVGEAGTDEVEETESGSVADNEPAPGAGKEQKDDSTDGDTDCREDNREPADRPEEQTGEKSLGEQIAPAQKSPQILEKSEPESIEKEENEAKSIEENEPETEDEKPETEVIEACMTRREYMNTLSLSLDGAPNSGQYTNISATALYCTGSKHRVVRTQDYGERLLCCYETPSPMFGDVGAAQTDETGKCLIFIDEKFAQTIDLEYLYDVFLTKYGPGDCYVSERTPSYFVVKGTKNLKFAWEVKTIQRDYENLRLEAHTREKDDTDYIYDVSAYMNTLLYQLD